MLSRIQYGIQEYTRQGKGDNLKTRMEQLINGRFEYEVPELELSATEIVLDILPEEKFRGELEFGQEMIEESKEWRIPATEDFFWERKNSQETG